MDSYVMDARNIAEQVVIVFAVDILHEDGAAIQATLDDVAQVTRQYKTTVARHVLIVPPAC
ncbi:MAG: hypothetical protein ABI767_14275 [Rhodanobacter sp.]